MSRLGLSIIFVVATLASWAQKHPLSKSDSGVVLQSLEKYEYLIQQNDLRGASGALNDAAFVFWNNNHYSEAAQYYEKSLVLNEKVANENGIAMINNNLGMLYFDLGEYQKSLESFTKTLASRRSNKEPVGIISALINMSTVLNKLDKYEESVTRLLDALDIARELYDIHQMRSVYGMLSETYEKMGNVEKSLQYFELYKSFHEEIQEQEMKTVNKQLQKERVAKQVLEVEQAKKENELLKQELELYKKEAEIQQIDSLNQTLYSNLSRKEVDIKLLEQDKQLSEMEAKTQLAINQRLKYFRNSLIIVIVALLIITVLIWINIRRTKKHRDELAQINVRLESQRKELAEANHTKDRIFSIISHDLRSPIKSLQGFFQYIEFFELPDELKSAFGGMELELINSVTLLDNLLAWSKSQIQKHEPDIAQFELKEVVDETIMLLQSSADKKNIRLSSQVDKGDLVNSDPQMLKIAARNLIQNAIKFTPSEGQVEVSYDADEHYTYVTVKDSGVGMSEEKVNSLFDIKTNRSSEGTANEKGSGLGLILTKELVEQAGGEIAVESEVNKGTAITLRFKNIRVTELV